MTIQSPNASQRKDSYEKQMGSVGFVAGFAGTEPRPYW